MEKTTAKHLFLSETIFKILIFGTLITAILLIYGSVWNFPFCYMDDNLYILDNTHVKAGLSIKNIIWTFDISPGKDKIYFQPVTWLSHMLDCQLFGLHSGMHHMENVMLHILNSILLFSALYKMTGAIWRSAFAAMLFAVHPLNVESVAWIAAKKNVLSTFFFMLTVLAYIHYANKPLIRRYIPVALLMFIGVLTKPMLVTLPCVLLLLDFWPMGRLDYSGTRDYSSSPDSLCRFKATSAKLLIAEKIPLFCISILVVLITLIGLKLSPAGLQSDSIIPFTYRLGNAAIAYLKYIYKLFWPHNLALFYPMPFKIIGWHAVYATICLLIITGTAAMLSKRWPFFIVGWLWFLGTLFPAIGFVQGGVWPEMADRWAYIPAIGLFLIFSWGGAAIFKWLNFKKFFPALISVSIIVALMIVSHHQLTYWSDNKKLFQHTFDITENNYFISYGLAEIAYEQKDYDLAIMHYEFCIQNLTTDECNTDDINHADLARIYLTHSKLAEMYMEKNLFKKADDHLKAAIANCKDSNKNKAVLLKKRGDAYLAQNKPDVAITYYEQALQANSSFIELNNNIGIAFLQLKQHDSAARSFNRILESAPYHVEANINMGIALTHLNQIDKAIAHYQTAIQYAPENAEANNNIGILYMEKEQFADAEKHFKAALTLSPDYTSAQTNLKKLQALRQAKRPFENNEQTDQRPNSPESFYLQGLFYQNAGQFIEAREAFQSAIQLNPKHVDARFRIAVIYSQQARYSEAINELKQLIAIKPDTPALYYNIACLQARQNNSEDAVEWLKKALNHGYANWDHIKTDPDLENIRGSSSFKTLLNKMNAN